METMDIYLHMATVYLVLILPMRNGNKSAILSFNSSLISSYPTYEEWKPIIHKSIRIYIVGSYPTYEEWKHNTVSTKLHQSTPVLILPMRNGNLGV